MRKFRKFYRTKDGLTDYAFSFEELSSGEWRAYIIGQPDYNGRNQSVEETHRLSEGERKYICWTDKVYSLADMMNISMLWAEGTQSYVRTGRFLTE